MSKLPFDRKIFWATFGVVMVLLVVTFFVLFKFTTYQLTNADLFGSLIAATIFSYLVHLWMLPGMYDDEDYYEEGEDVGEDALQENVEDSPEGELPVE